MPRHKKTMSKDDREAWKKVATTIEPLKTRHSLPLKPDKPQTTAMNAFEIAMAAQHSVRKKPEAPAIKASFQHQGIYARQQQSPHQVFDQKTVKKIARGKISIDARIDLHGMTQEQAITALRRFIHMAHASDYRLVLVITGKGSTGQGILRQRVPDWLSTGELSSIVSGVREAGISHGGAGALYVRLRRA